MRVAITKLFGFGSQNTYYQWKKEIDKRPILKLIEKYFSKEELDEFLEIGKINKFENLEYIKNQFMTINMESYIKDFNDNSLISCDFLINDFFFFFLKKKKGLLKNGFNNEYTLLKSINHYLYNDFIEEFENIYKEENISISQYLNLAEAESNSDELTKSKTAISDTFKKKDEIFNYILRCLYFAQFWSRDMDTFLNILIEDEFEFFINSGNDELLYHSIGFLAYSNNQIENLSIKDKLEMVSKTFEYFIYNKKLINLNNIKNHILLRASNSPELKKLDDAITKHKEILKEEENRKIGERLRKNSI